MIHLTSPFVKSTELGSIKANVIEPLFAVSTYFLLIRRPLRFIAVIHNMTPDYSLYLVTDSGKAILGNRDLVDVVSRAIDGGECTSSSKAESSLTSAGVTIVQYRDKNSDTGQLIRVAAQLLRVTKVKGVPLIINDRVDVAMAVGADGVHLGQDDMGR